MDHEEKDKTAFRKRKRSTTADADISTDTKKTISRYLVKPASLRHDDPFASVGSVAKVVNAKQRWRRKGRQGAPPKCPALRQSLFEWFVDLRFAVATSIPPSYALREAKRLGEKLVRQMRRKRQFILWVGCEAGAVSMELRFASRRASTK